MMGRLTDWFSGNGTTSTEAAIPEGKTLVDRGILDTLELRLEEASKAALRQLQAEDQGWASLSAGTIDRGQLLAQANLVRAFSTMNPLMKRGKVVRAGYVVGDGITISARDKGEDEGHQDVAAVVDAFIHDERNQESVFGHDAHLDRENDLFDDGNVFYGHWVNPLTGAVQVRQILFDQVTRIYKKPGDDLVPWFYLREWTEQLPGDSQPVQKAAWYPALSHQPVNEIRTLEGKPILWPGKRYPGYGTGAAVYHLKVNAVGRDRTWGVGDGAAAMPWARAYKEFLEDWTRLMRALSRIAWHMQDKGGKSQMARAAADAYQGQAGGTAYGTMELQAPSTQGARFDANSGRPVASMVAAGLGVTVTILTADPGQEGARAVAETLDRPQRLEMQARQQVHAKYLRAACAFAIEAAVRAPRGPLKGRIEQRDDRQVAVFLDQTDPAVEITMAELEDISTAGMMEAISKADATNKLPPLETLKLILAAFGYEDPTGILDQVTDDDGNWVDPYATAAGAAGQSATDLLRRGGDPSTIL